MQPGTAAIWTTAFAVLFALLWRSLRGQAFATISDGPARGDTTMPDEDDDEMPETDRAPSSPNKWPAVAYAVAGAATLRIALLLALHR